MMDIKVEFRSIPIAHYLYIRSECGLGTKTVEAALLGQGNSLCSVVAVDQKKKKTIGMGRIIGDLGCYCQITDICVLPRYQGSGIENIIMQHLMDYIKLHVPETCYISYIADGKAYQIGEEFGFKSTQPDGIGMFLIR